VASTGPARGPAHPPRTVPGLLAGGCGGTGSDKRRLAATWPSVPAPERSWWSRWGRSLVPAAGVAVLLLVALPLYYQRASLGPGNGSAGMVREAVNAYVRLLSSQHPLEIESGGIHQGKPWFEGRLDFAPVIAFDGKQEFPLRGGSIGYFLGGSTPSHSSSFGRKGFPGRHMAWSPWENPGRM
jgi:hypothetical protein